MPRNKKRHRSQRLPTGIPSAIQPAPAPASALARLPALRLARTLLTSLVLVAVTALAYAPVRQNGFVWDDQLYVLENPPVRAGLSWPGAAWAFTTGYASNWHPLTWLSLQLDSQLFGLRPLGYHWNNLAMHMANTLLLLGLLWKMTGAWWRSTLVAALFALHPLHVESVAWIAERKDVLSTLFGFLALLAYVGYVKRPGLGRYLLVCLAFLASLLAKPMLVTLPFVLLLLDYWPLRRLRLARNEDAAGPTPVRLSRLLWEKVPLFLLAAASGAITWYVQQHGHSVQALAQLPPGARVGNAVVAYVVYLRKLVWPADLAAYYPHPRTTLPLWEIAASALLLAVVTALAWRLRRRAPYLMVGWFWYLGTLVPVIGLVQVGNQALADRYTYVPLVGIFMAVAWGMGDLMASRPIRERYILAAGTTIMILVLAMLTWLQVYYWQDNIAVWSRALEVEPRNPFPHTNLGVAIMAQGSLPRNKELGFEVFEEPAFKHFAEAVALDPYELNANLNLGTLMLNRGRVEEAIQRFRVVVRLEPASMRGHHHLGTALALEKQWNEAEHHLREAIRLNPEEGVNFAALGQVMRSQGRLKEAITSLRRAASLAPEEVGYHCALALALHEDGQVEQGRKEYKQATRLNPNWPKAVDQAARRLATHPDSTRRNAAQAVELASQACQATADREPRFLDTLAAAYAEAGRFDEAVATVNKALNVARAEGPRDYLAQGQERLKLYQQRQPLREPEARAAP